jgi:hypothetical protein
MTKEEAANFLLADKDKYVQNLTPIDLYARKVTNSQEYLEKISKITLSFSSVEKDKLLKCIYDADMFFKNISVKHIPYYKHIKCKDIAAIKWTLALTDTEQENKYEEGLPHTREDLIFLSKHVLNYTEENLTNTLIHEKVHIYQRYNTALFDKVIHDMNYRILDLNTMPNREYIRSNPDINKNIYYDMTTKKELVCFYRSNTPSSISDVIINSFSLEHPYEKIAYEIANLYNDKYINKYMVI